MDDFKIEQIRSQLEDISLKNKSKEPEVKGKDFSSLFKDNVKIMRKVYQVFLLIYCFCGKLPKYFYSLYY